MIIPFYAAIKQTNHGTKPAKQEKGQVANSLSLAIPLIFPK